MFQTKVPVVEPKSTKVTVPLKAGFGRVEDILFGEERLAVSGARAQQDVLAQAFGN